MRSLVLTIIFSILMNNTLFAAFEEAECDMDIEVELLAIERKEKKEKRQQAKNKTNVLVEEQKSLMSDADYQQITDGDQKNTTEPPASHIDF